MTAAWQADAIGKQRSALRHECLSISLIELQAVVPAIHLRRKSTKSLDGGLIGFGKPRPQFRSESPLVLCQQPDSFFAVSRERGFSQGFVFAYRMKPCKIGQRIVRRDQIMTVEFLLIEKQVHVRLQTRRCTRRDEREMEILVRAGVTAQ